jgi:hypothetical protein
MDPRLRRRTRPSPRRNAARQAAFTPLEKPEPAPLWRRLRRFG